MESMKRFGLSAQDLMNQAAKRQSELKDPAMRDDLAAARSVFMPGGERQESFLIFWSFFTLELSSRNTP